MAPATHQPARRNGFLAKREGSVALIAGLLMPVLFLLGGATIDFTSAFNARKEARNSLDATLLQLASANIPDSELQARGAKVLSSFIRLADDRLTVAASSFSGGADGDGDGLSDTIQGEATVEARYMFLPFIGMTEASITVGSEVQKPDNTAQEIALVLDVSGSMTNDLNGASRLERLKQAADGMFTVLGEELSPAVPLSVAVVPYSTSVNLGSLPGGILEASSLAGNAAPAPGADVWAAERFVSDNGNSFGLSDAGPASGAIRFVTATEIHHASPLSRMQPLSSNAAIYGAALDGLTAEGWTAAHLGMIWGVYALSPAWSPVWTEAPRAYGAADKTIVVLTDGEFNTTHAIGAGSTADGTVSNAYFQSACKLAKTNGIRIYTVALSLDATSEARLKKCAKGSGGDSFSANSASDLITVFQQIAGQIGKLRVTM